MAHIKFNYTFDRNIPNNMYPCLNIYDDGIEYLRNDPERNRSFIGFIPDKDMATLISLYDFMTRKNVKLDDIVMKIDLVITEEANRA